jgi:hypothetical protein
MSSNWDGQPAQYGNFQGMAAAALQQNVGRQQSATGFLAGPGQRVAAKRA